MSYISPRLLLLSVSMIVWSCKTSPDNPASGEEPPSITPVTITHPVASSIAETITLNAISTYLLKTDIKANINGYITEANLQVGSTISRGQALFTLETKEARSLGNTINDLDPSFRFSGVSRVKSQVTGHVTMLNHQKGDYVQDGETLASITDNKSFGFILDLPYEDHQLLVRNKKVAILLPDGTSLQGYVAQIMPTVDSISQTQKILIKLSGSHNTIPENLIAKIVLKKSESSHLLLPKTAVFSDEGQLNFWAMKIINDSTSIKIPLTKGIENDTLVEVISPHFNVKDTFIMQGGYGLPDTARVSIQP